MGELMDLLFDLVFPVQGGDFPVKMQFKDLIFVMEDVDAASKVVYSRGGTKKQKKEKEKVKKKKTDDKLQTVESSGTDATSTEATTGAASSTDEGKTPPAE